MRSDPEFESFLKKWRAALHSPRNIWEGPRAVAELERAGYTEKSKSAPDERVSMLSFVRCDPQHRWRPREMLKRVLAEVEDYKRQKLSWQKEFRATELFLAGIGRKVILRRGRVADDRLKELLARTANAIEEQRKALKNLTDPAELSPLGPMELLWEKNARAENIGKEIELDTRLQLQMAKMFRTPLHPDVGVSRRTIARLVLLAYLVSGLAAERKDDGFLWIVGSDRKITTRNVEDKLRRNKIH
jgi:hypothetical protein